MPSHELLARLLELSCASNALPNTQKAPYRLLGTVNSYLVGAYLACRALVTAKMPKDCSAAIKRTSHLRCQIIHRPPWVPAMLPFHDLLMMFVHLFSCCALAPFIFSPGSARQAGVSKEVDLVCHCSAE